MKTNIISFIKKISQPGIEDDSFKTDSSIDDESFDDLEKKVIEQEKKRNKAKMVLPSNRQRKIRARQSMMIN
jgi:hypothetical protein